MISVTTAVANAINATTRMWDVKLIKVSDSSEISCDLKSITIHKGACGTFTVGSVFVPYVQIEAFGKLTVSEEFIVKCGVLVNNSFEYINIGYFTPTESAVSSATTSIKAQGRLANMPGEVLYTTEPATKSLQGIIADLTTAGYSFVYKNGFTVTSATITQNLAGLSSRECLQIVALCCGGFATEDNAGNIVLSKFNDCTSASISMDGERTTKEPAFDGAYEIRGCKVEVSDDEVYEEADYNLIVSNKYFTSSMWNAYKGNLTGLEFETGSIGVTLGDPRLEAWDCIKWTDYDLVEHLVPCLELTFTYNGGLSMSIEADAVLDEESSTNTVGSIQKIAIDAATARKEANQAVIASATAAQAAEEASESATSAYNSAYQAQQSASTASGAAQTASDAAVSASTSATNAGIAATGAQTAAQACIDASYIRYGTRSFDDTTIATKCAPGYSEAWSRTSGYWAGEVKTGQMLIIDVTQTNHNNKVSRLYLQATANASAGASVTASVLTFENLDVYFWHDSSGAHILSSTSGCKTTLDGDGMEVFDATNNDSLMTLGIEELKLFRDKLNLSYTYHDDGLGTIWEYGDLQTKKGELWVGTSQDATEVLHFATSGVNFDTVVHTYPSSTDQYSMIEMATLFDLVRPYFRIATYGVEDTDHPGEAGFVFGCDNYDHGSTQYPDPEVRFLTPKVMRVDSNDILKTMPYVDSFSDGVLRLKG